MAKPKEKTIGKMDEDMEGLLHNGPIQRKWKELRQVLEKNAEKESEDDEKDGKKEES